LTILTSSFTTVKTGVYEFLLLIQWITVKMTKMIMMMASSAFDLNHIGGPNDIPSMPSFKSV
jgi:hypothetical protein